MRDDRKKPPPVQQGEVVSASIETLPLGPDSVARARGYVLFVPGGIPGERVHVRVTEAGRRFGRGEIVDVIEASPDRGEPVCPLYLACGGGPPPPPPPPGRGPAQEAPPPRPPP